MACENLVVAVKQGKLRGVKDKTLFDEPYLAFRGIPYAKPPVGPLRFKDPQPPEPWTGIKEAKDCGSGAIQINFFNRQIEGNEDCLYLNVYTPSIETSSKRAVMVWIHGGGFIAGSGDSMFYGPDYLIRKDIVMVAINYRIGVFGFFNVAHKVASGNQGLKDQVMALKWVRENISSFGGDPENVTIFGESAGSAAVHYLTISPLARGLFDKAIAQSGVAINPWAVLSEKPEKSVYKLAAALGKDSKDPEEVVQFLQTVDAMEVFLAAKNLVPREMQHLLLTCFYPSVDDASPTPFMPRHPAEMTKLGVQVPFILGYNTCEGSVLASPLLIPGFEDENVDALFDEMNSNVEMMLHPEVRLEMEKDGVSPQDIRHLYFGDRPITREMYLNYVDMMSDMMFVRGIYDVVKAQAENSNAPDAYFYKFTYHDGNKFGRVGISSQLTDKMENHTQYLDAIQSLPGATPGEKHRWMTKLIRDRLSECNNLEEVVESEKIPRSLAPLMQIQAAQMLNKKNPSDKSAYGAIAEALKSEDSMVVNRGLHVKSFFDGSNPTVTNVQYFFENIFPYVSRRTRKLIVKALANNLASRNPNLAAKFFDAVASTFELDQALPLLVACSDEFVYSKIVERKIVLSHHLAQVLFKKSPDLIVRYLKLSKPWPENVRNAHNVQIFKYFYILKQLVKTRIEAFVEICEMHEENPVAFDMSNKCAEALLKKGWDQFQRKPKLYIGLVPLKTISAAKMEAIFPKLFPESIVCFNTDGMLKYLQLYPEEKRLELLLNSYREVYGDNLLDYPNNITVSLLKILPVEERVKQVKMKLKQGWRAGKMDYLNTGRCYLPVAETIPEIKEEVSKTPEMQIRAALVCQMIYCCKVNQDDQALLEVLEYYKDRHKNEQAWFQVQVFICLTKIYELHKLSDDHWAILTHLLIRENVKDSLNTSINTSFKMLEEGIKHKLMQNQSIDQLITILVDLKSYIQETNWCILSSNPEYERICLDACLKLVSQRYLLDKSPWKEKRIKILCDLAWSIYFFNESHSKDSKVEQMTLKSYPWLLNELETGVITKTDHYDLYAVDSNLRHLMKKYDKVLYDRLFNEKHEILEDMKSGSALATLKKSPEDVLSRWEEYLKACQDNWSHPGIKRFVRAIRWYQGIPVKFAGRCLQDLLQKKKPVCLDILGTLLPGRNLAKIIEPLMPMNKTLDVHGEEAKTIYDLVHSIVTSAKVANPPFPLELIGRLCEGDYLSIALIALNNVSIRTPLMDAMSFARTLASQRVSVRKHGVRIMRMVAPREQLYHFLLTQWKTEDHYSIREVLIHQAKDLFCAEPNDASWSLLYQMISTLAPKDEKSFASLQYVIPSLPEKYVAVYFKMLLETIDRLAEAGLDPQRVKDDTVAYLLWIDSISCEILPEDFLESLLRRFLLHPEVRIAKAASSLVSESYLLPTSGKFESRLRTFSNVFVEVVKNGWNVSHPRKSHFYPVNYMLQDLIRDLLQTHSSSDSRVIDRVLEAFLGVLTPQADPTSYLLLVFGKEKITASTVKEFGDKAGQKMSDLTEIFSPLLMHFIADTLKSLLNGHKFKSDSEFDKLDLIEGVVDVGTMEAAQMGVYLLTSTVSRVYMDRYDKLLMKFAGFDHPAIKSSLCDLVNKRSFENCPFDE